MSNHHILDHVPIISKDTFTTKQAENVKPLHLEDVNQIIITSTINMTVRTSVEVITPFITVSLLLFYYTECPPTCSLEFCLLNRFNICSM